MKKRIYGILAMISMLFAGTGCDNAKYNNIPPHAFLNESVGTIGVAGSKIIYPRSGSTVELSVVLSKPVDSDVSFCLKLDEEVLKRYNNEQGSSYDVMESSLYEIGEPVTIPAGKFDAKLAIALKAIDEDYEPGTYAIPVRLERISGDVEPTPLTSSFVAAFEVIKPPVTLPMFNGASGLGCRDFGQKLTQFTIETRFQVSNTANRNRDVFTNGGSVLLRFEDPQNDNSDHKAHSLVQFQGQGWYLNPSKSFKPNVWQHLALTYDGKAVTLYINGENAGTKEGTCNPEFNVVGWFGGNVGDGGGHGTGSTWWRGCKIIPHEARVWSTCRTESQIQNNMTGVSTKSEGLVGYWSFEKKTFVDGGFEDLTGNGHKLLTGMNITWIEDIPIDSDHVDW